MEEFIEYNKAGGYISELTFNNGQKVNIAPNDIIVFVGPNNAGKSQSLKDINELCSKSRPNDSPLTTWSRIQLIKISIDNMLESVSITVTTLRLKFRNL